MMDRHGGVRSRRDFLHALTGVVALGVLPVSALAVSPTRGRDGGPAGAAFGGHPEPRPGIDGSSVLDPGTVREDLAGTFEGIRAIPHIADGIGCHCGCGAMPEMRSLLSCYEGIGMAQFCVICEGEGRLAVQLHAEGMSLEEIRTAIDRRYG